MKSRSKTTPKRRGCYYYYRTDGTLLLDRSEADDSPRLLVEREGHAEVGAEAREGRQRAAEESEGSVGAEDGRRAAERRGEKRPPRLRVARAH